MTVATPAFATLKTETEIKAIMVKRTGWYDTGKSRDVAVKQQVQKGSYKVGKKTYKYRVRYIYKTQKQQAYYKNGTKIKTRWVADKNATEPWRYSNTKPESILDRAKSSVDGWVSLLGNQYFSGTVSTNSGTGTGKK